MEFIEVQAAILWLAVSFLLLFWYTRPKSSGLSSSTETDLTTSVAPVVPESTIPEPQFVASIPEPSTVGPETSEGAPQSGSGSPITWSIALSSGFESGAGQGNPQDAVEPSAVEAASPQVGSNDNVQNSPEPAHIISEVTPSSPVVVPPAPDARPESTQTTPVVSDLAESTPRAGPSFTVVEPSAPDVGPAAPEEVPRKMVSEDKPDVGFRTPEPAVPLSDSDAVGNTGPPVELQSAPQSLPAKPQLHNGPDLNNLALKMGLSRSSLEKCVDEMGAKREYNKLEATLLERLKNIESSNKKRPKSQASPDSIVSPTGRPDAP